MKKKKTKRIRPREHQQNPVRVWNSDRVGETTEYVIKKEIRLGGYAVIFHGYGRTTRTLTGFNE